MWVYNDADVIKAVSANPSKPEFLVPSLNPFYRIPYGSSSHYGDHILPVLRSIAQCKGTVHILKQKITCRQIETKRNNSIIITSAVETGPSPTWQSNNICETNNNHL